MNVTCTSNLLFGPRCSHKYVRAADRDMNKAIPSSRRWGFMVPWAFVYAANILGLFTSSMVLFFWLPGGSKAFGLVPLVWCAGILFGYCIVVFFIMEQRADLDIYLTQQQNALARGNSDAAVSWYTPPRPPRQQPQQPPRRQPQRVASKPAVASGRLAVESLARDYELLLDNDSSTKSSK